MDLKEWVKAAREAAGMTQTRLGEELGVTKGNVSGWENGRHEPSYSQMLKMAELSRWSVPLPGLGGVDTKTGNSAVNAEPWPFPNIDEAKIRAVAKNPGDLQRLEGGFIAAAGFNGFDVLKKGAAAAGAQ
ncbi:helix-turn-helix transcriptional regulator [Pigmentiphaga soli]